MKKSFMNNIKNFVDSNVRQRIDRVANNNSDFFDDDLLLVERQFEDIRQICVEADKRISALLSSLSHSNPTLGVHSSTNNLSSNLSTVNSSSTATIFANEVQSTSNQTNSSDKQPFKSSATHPHPILESQALANNVTINSSNNLLLQLSNSIINPDDATEFHHNDIRRFKKLPIVGFLKFLVKSRSKSKPDSLLNVTLTHCSQLQTQLTQLYLTYERTIETQCLIPIRQILEIDVPNVIKLRKLFIKSHNDLESVRAKYNGASLKQQQSQTTHFTSTSYTIQQTSIQLSNINKLDQLKKELDEAVTRFEQAGDNYATELYTFVCRETELVNLFIKFYQHQAEYQLQVSEAISNSLPTLSNTLTNTSRKAVFGTPLEEHLQSTGRSLALVIELCLHLLYLKALTEEGLFRIPGGSIKIKKLKSAIDAWFVTLASQDELNNNQQGSKSSGSCKSALSAIHNLFKDIAGQTQISHDAINTKPLGEALSNKSLTARDDSTLTHSSVVTPTPNSTATTTSDHIQQCLVFDVHTIAGLLKLYLRELPEPLFTHALYQQWIDTSVKTMSSKQLIAFEQVIQQLPSTHYDNLRFLIRFLHLLTLYSDSNKMTATNLAITMAPSLIWAPTTINTPNNRTTNRDQKLSSLPHDHQHEQDDVQALNFHLSNVGISASLHALVIENLIIHAESLFPGPIQFRIADLDEVSELPDTLSKQDRCLKSSSPTGLSTASSSSFSSSSNASATSSSTSKSHSRRGGSIDGLIDDELKSKQQQAKQTRPASVHIQRSTSQHSQAPPLPPAPVSRSNLRQNADSPARTSQQASSSQPIKPPAPPLPPPSSYHRQQARPSPLPPMTKLTISTDSNSLPPVAASCRGTGRVTAAPSPTFTATRPSVPPPNRPSKAQSGDDGIVHASFSIPSVSKAAVEDIDSKSSHSIASSGNLRTDFEEVSAVDVDDIELSVPSVSPNVSFDSMSEDEIGFDNESQSLEQSWTECDLDQNQENILKSATKSDGGKSKLNTSQHSPSPVTKPPVKPPRCISPKITQSTPL